MKYLAIAVLAFLFCSCQAQQPKQVADNEATVKMIAERNLYDYDVAYFASGCFWCVEAIYESVPGVVEAIAGYSGGHTDFVNYALSGTGETGHAEAVQIFYDANIISYAELVKIYFASQDVEQANGQGPDRGSEYRSILFYQTEGEKTIIDKAIAQLKTEGVDVAAEVKPFEQFFVAEDYHQDFKTNNPNNPYIKNVSDKRYKKFKEKYNK